MEYTLNEAFPVAQIVGVNEKPDPASPFEAILHSIEEDGVQCPVVVNKHTFKLIAGHSRVLACIKLELPTIPAWLVDYDADSPEARYFAFENDLHHKWFNQLEQDLRLAHNKKLYEQIHPETKQGSAGAFVKHNPSATAKISFAKHMAQIMKVTTRTVELWISAGEQITPEAADLLKSSTTITAKNYMTNQKEISYLANQPAAMQPTLVKVALGKDDFTFPKVQPIKSFKDANQYVKHATIAAKYDFLSTDKFPFVTVISLSRKWQPS